jgi:hypothetical protein
LIGNYHFAHDYRCEHPGMPLGRKHLRRNRDAPNLGWTIQRTAFNLSRTRREVNVPKELDAVGCLFDA